MSMGGAERGGDTESKAGSRLRAVSTECNTGLELINREITTWAKVGCLTDWATKVPLYSLFFNVYLFILRERDRAWAGEGQRERETQNPKQAPGSELSAQSPTWGSNPPAVRLWPEPKSAFLIHSDTLCLLIGAFSPFTFRVIIERYGFTVIMLSVGFVLVVMSLVLCSLCRIPLTESPLGFLAGLV